MRDLLRAGVALALVVLLAGCGRSGINAPEGFQRYQDSNSTFTLVYPDNWAFQTDPKGAIRLSDPADPSYQVSVLVSNAPADPTRKGVKDVTAFGTPKAVADRFANEVLKKKSYPDAVIEVSNPAQRKDNKGITYYTFEVVLAAGGKANHQIYCIAVNQGKVYTLVTGSSAISWGSRRKKIYQIVDSFTVS